MFDGSRHLAAGEHVRLLEEAGGSKIDGSTDFEATTFVETVPPGRLPLALWLESERMGFLAERVDAEAVTREWQAADAEEDETHRGTGVRAGREALFGEIFPAGHPYHRDSNRIGLGVFGLGDVQRFMHTWYSPANATLVVAGAFDAAATLALAEKYFAGLAAPAPPARAQVADERKVPDVWLDVTAAMPFEIVAFDWLAPPIDQQGDLALDLAATVLRNPGGRVERELVERGLAHSVTVREQSQTEGSVFHFDVNLTPGVDPAAVITAVDQILADLGTRLTPAEVEPARRAWKDLLLARLQTSAGRVSVLARPKPLTDPFDLAKYDAIDAATIMATVRRVLVPARSAVMVVHKVPTSPWYGVVVHREERAQ
jgi:zinc protease